MSRNTPPKHRHDGTSPLPLGMDWSPPPRRWDGNNTIWPHNSQTGWSFCVMVPSWIVQTEPGSSHESFMNPIVFYRIHVGIQSPEGVSTSHGLLRRFSDFLKLYSALKKAFPIKDIPPAPPKHAFLRINSNRLLLEERRHALEDWMGKLLSDLDLSRSALVAGFLELEAAARSAFQYASNHHTESSSSADATVATPFFVAEHSLNASAADRVTVASNSPSVASDICSDIADGASDPGTPRKGQSSLDQPEDFMRGKLNGRTHLVPDREMIGTSSSRDITECISDRDHNKLFGHSRKLSGDSMGSDISSIKGSEVSFFGGSNSIWDGSLDVPGGADITNAMDGTQFIDNAQIILPIDQRHKLTRVLVTVQQRLVTAKTDMEDLIVRLNQEMAVKEYLTTKVKDLEVELEASEQRGKENLQQTILIERERVTQMQWDMDELRRKCAEMEAKVKLEQNEKSRVESEKTIANDERELLIQQLGSKQEYLDNMRKYLEELELKSKADIKVLVKEVKFLRKSQAELKEMLNQSLREKTELEGVLCKERRRLSKAKSANKTLLHECRVLRDRLQECSVNFPMDEQEKFIGNPSSLADTLDLLETSDNRIGLLLAEAQLLATNDEADELGSAEEDDSRTSELSESPIAQNGGTTVGPNDEIREILTDMFIDNARLRKQVNSVIRCALNATIKPAREDSSELPTRKTVLNRFLER